LANEVIYIYYISLVLREKSEIVEVARVQTVFVQLCGNEAAAEQTRADDVDPQRANDKCFRRPIDQHHSDPPTFDMVHLLLHITNNSIIIINGI